jgi:hypothetical protein
MKNGETDMTIKERNRIIGRKKVNYNKERYTHNAKEDNVHKIC